MSGGRRALVFAACPESSWSAAPGGWRARQTHTRTHVRPDGGKDRSRKVSERLLLGGGLPVRHLADGHLQVSNVHRRKVGEGGGVLSGPSLGLLPLVVGGVVRKKRQETGGRGGRRVERGDGGEGRGGRGNLYCLPAFEFAGGCDTAIVHPLLGRHAERGGSTVSECQRREELCFKRSTMPGTG